MEHADRFLRRFYIEKGMFGSLSVTFIFYRPPLTHREWQLGVLQEHVDPAADVGFLGWRFL